MMKGNKTCNQYYISSHLWVKCLVGMILVLWIQILFATTELNMVQGGMITAALDDATAMVIISAYEFKFRPLTTDLHVLFHRPVPLGEATIEVKIIKLGKKLATVEGKLFNSENKLAATLLHTIQPTEIADGATPLDKI